MPLQHILIATDFGPASERAFDTAIDLAEKFGARLTVLNVLEPEIYPYPIGGPAALPIDTLETQRTAAAKRLEADVAAAQKHVPGAQGVIRQGSAWPEIVAAANEGRADLVVVGSHGRRGLPHRLLGSVAERVVHMSRVPVLTVHGYWFEDRVQAGRELAAALEPWRAHMPTVVAISRGGIVVGAEVAHAMNAPFDLLLTGSLEVRGTTVGAVCEGGMTHFSPGGVTEAVAAEDKTKLISKVRSRIQEDAVALRGDALPGDFWRRVVIVVSDAFVEPWRALVAADALAKMGPEAMVFAAPVATEEAFSALKARFPNVTALHMLRGGAEPSAAYRNFRTPSGRTLGKLLEGAAAPVARSA